MPEGPTIFLLKEALERFTGKKILAASGNAKIDMNLLAGKRILQMRTWGKQFFIFTKDTVLRIHFLMFGAYSINEQTRLTARIKLRLDFGKEQVYFYSCSLTQVEDPTEIYDWQADTLSAEWNPRKARTKLKALPETMVCDALLNQQIFSGVGNIIKVEVLYRVMLHPETLIKNLPPKMLSALIKEARNYSFDFLKWKRVYELKKHWLAYTKKKCKRCDLPFIKKYCGLTKRRTFFCENCQVKYE